MGAIEVGTGDSVGTCVTAHQLLRTDMEAAGPKSRIRSVLTWAATMKHPR